MYRELDDKLSVWKASTDKKPLIIKGSRQVGKTYSIRKFGNQNYDHCIEINFEYDQDYKNFFHTTKNPNELYKFIELKNINIDLSFGSILLFLDEIQACPEAITALKFMKEQLPFDVIASGSVLEVAIASTSSFPVGYVETWDMYPMNFIEFLLAMNIKEQYITELKQHYDTLTPLSQPLHDLFLDFFRQYMLCGGMPEVVLAYLQNKSYKDALLVQRRIVSDYTNDMAKYAPAKDKMKAHECFHSIPLQLAKENKKFQYKLVKQGYNARYYDSSLQWLIESGLIIKVTRLKCIEMPLEAYMELPVFKVYMFDTGLLISQFDDAVVTKIYQNELGMFKGVLYENICAQILKSKQKKVYYYEPSSSSEIDFITYSEGEIVPIEVKAGKNTSSPSFHRFVEQYHSKISYRFSSKNVGKQEGSIKYLPYYMIPFLND